MLSLDSMADWMRRRTWLWRISTATSTKGRTSPALIPESNQTVRLFHPRKDRWQDHFAWRGVELAGLTAIGSTTVRVLKINAPRRLGLRISVLKWSKLD
jgi:hypothetical protein